MPPPDRYNTGYNVGVGGAVVNDGRLLLVRRASRRGRGNWQIPGGFVEQNEPEEFFHNPQNERTKLFLSQILAH